MTITIELMPEDIARLAEDAHFKGLSLEEYVQRQIVTGERPKKRKITDLEGLGKELWEGVDVRKYLDELRDY